ncbi:methylated-DNA-[protein]-cysteine S-methyltransferase [Ulvibacter sp. MAR_2010_11]|uniref:methylated-DNA--[protein]-cysteine S-methyltransferase n=1 Tax=Ulvibacter sp. MAR_2010_11 TaxID=1250229 RepID=UPI000C2BC5B3|nr:methylated-DNA--[protein]-cysteine S-methyltransferase [Ulvibacter sp. MAR_2010_11]PKA82863.1 methylated-DNA-[protein]-cysteine S-methyltransferase [Ulvibacter sp. MAR_2010_11]
METSFLQSPIGIIKITGDSSGIRSVEFTDASEIIAAEIPSELFEATTQLTEYFEGKRSQFDLQLSPEGTEFQKKVWHLLTTIPFGKTSSYQEIANKLGDPKVIRAAASANGKNPIAIIIPCHRVIGSDGSLTGYAGGLHRKKWLLEHENPVKQQSLF